MQQADLVELLKRARTVLDRYMFEAGGEAIRDDVAEVCMAIDDVLPVEGRVQPKRVELDRSALERSVA
jgi:hypothetical protein